MPVMPEIYHGRKSKSDRLRISRWMSVIPDDQQSDIAKEYSQIYLKLIKKEGLKAARDAANSFLLEKAKPYRDKLRALSSGVSYA